LFAYAGERLADKMSEEGQRAVDEFAA